MEAWVIGEAMMEAEVIGEKGARQGLLVRQK